MSDPIGPLTARRPEEAVELVSLAVSDGDLEAALAQYEDGALLRPWALPPGQAGPGVQASPATGAGPVTGADPVTGAGVADWPGDGVRDVLLCLMGLRLPLSVQVRAVLPAGDLAMVLGERRISGTGPDCEPVELSGLGFTVVRHEPAGAWCIVAEAWCLDGPGPASTRD